MKRIISILLVIIQMACINVAFAETEKTEQESNSFSFKGLQWGSSKEEVIEVEGKPIFETSIKDTLGIVYDTTVVGLKTYLLYYFSDRGLFGIHYMIQEKHTSNSKYIDDFIKIKTALTKKYGDPVLDKEEWDTTTHKEYYTDDKGYGLLYGYLRYCTSWIVDDTMIICNMSAENYNISTEIIYQSPLTPESLLNPDYSDEI